MRFIATRRVPITSTVGVESVPTASAVDATVEGFPTPLLPKHPGKPDYAAIRETHQLLTANAASVECNLGGGHNGYLGLILPPEQYERLSGTAFILPPDPGRTAHVPARTAPAEEKRALREYTKKRRLYDEYRTVDADLKNQLLAVFDDPYPATLKNRYTGYATRSTMYLLTNIYKNYARISPSDMAAKGERLRSLYNTEEPLESLIERLDECTDFVTAAGEPVSEN